MLLNQICECSKVSVVDKNEYNVGHFPWVSFLSNIQVLKFAKTNLWNYAIPLNETGTREPLYSQYAKTRPQETWF